MSTNQDSKSKLLPWAIAVIIALAGTNIFTWLNLGKEKQTVVVTETKLKTEEDLNQKLDADFKQATSDLEAMKGKNTELNATIDKQLKALSEQKTKISGLINVKNDRDAARAELANMRNQVQGYMAEIATLQNDKKDLTNNLAKTTTEKAAIQQNLATVSAEKEKEIAQKNSILEEKAKLEKEKAEADKKVTIGSVVKVTNIATTGYAVNSKGKESEKTSATKIDRLKWCFDALENQVTKSGDETFYVRVIDPTGVAISTSNSGGGVLKLNDGKDVQYTCTKTAAFSNVSQNVCLTWDVKGNATLQKGQYIFEVYNKGFLAGKTSFPLK
jgi:hypothetical protein